MLLRLALFWFLLVLPHFVRPWRARADPTFRVASFNVENYLVRAVPGRVVKPLASREAVARHLVDLRPDVVALQEVGDADAVADLQSRLRARGLDLPHAHVVPGHDPSILVAVISRFPFLSRRSHTNESYLVDGRRLRSGRGIAEVMFEPSPGHRVLLLAGHLKSRRAVGAASESDMREQEAILLREKIDALLDEDMEANVVVCGDFNDVPGSPALRALMGRGVRALVDTRPAEPWQGPPGEGPAPGRWVTWTHYFAREDVFSRIDYILVSRGLAREWRREGTRVHGVPDWGMASDHRPIVAEFEPPDR